MKTLLSLLVIATAASASNVRIKSVPEGGLQPQVAVDAAGTVHLVYLKGEPESRDVRYVRRAKGQDVQPMPPAPVSAAPRNGGFLP